MLHGFRLLFHATFGIAKIIQTNKQIIAIVHFRAKHALGLIDVFPYQDMLGRPSCDHEHINKNLEAWQYWFMPVILNQG